MERRTVIRGPQSCVETGIPPALLEGLALKILYSKGEATLSDLSENIKLGNAVVEEIFQRLRNDHLCEVKGMVGLVHRIALTSAGRTRALDLMSSSQYAGPAPVSLDDYATRVRAQSVTATAVRPADVVRALEPLVLDSRTRSLLGRAIVSGTSVLLYGPPGTGKTSIAEILPDAYGDRIWVPYAVEVRGEIISVYDAAVHVKIEGPLRSGLFKEDNDARWVLCRRPRMVVGGELTIEMLDLRMDAINKFYSAPVQMKANNGVLVVDDFGRQLVSPEALLNRWIVPLDRRVDFLTLTGGMKFEIPFDLFVVFATNLNPADLGDEAFFRRIPNKIRVGEMTREQFHEICCRVCRGFDLEFDAAVVDHLIDILTTELRRPLRACYPRDIVRQICWKARYDGTPPRFDRIAVAEACSAFFDFDINCLSAEAQPCQPGVAVGHRQRPTDRHGSTALLQPVDVGA